MKMLKRILLPYLAAMVFATGIGGAAMTVTAGTQPVGACSNTRLLTFPAWYRGVTEGSGENCRIRNPNEVGGLSNFIWRIVLNVIEIMLQIVGYVSVGYIIWGGFRYMISTGTPDKMAGARKTIMNAVIGLVLSIASIAIVNVIAGAIN